MRLESKMPGATLAYEVDLAPQLAAGEVLTGTPTALRTAGDVTIEAGVSKSGTKVQFRLSGGTSWTDNRIELSCPTDKSEVITAEVWVFVT